MIDPLSNVSIKYFVAAEAPEGKHIVCMCALL